MKKMNRTQKSWMIIGLCLIVLFMAIGYASFATDLTITGTSKITSTWDVRITDIKVKSFTGSATKAEEPAVTSNTTATFKTNLVSPGDSMTYTVTVANEGNISARLDDMTIEQRSCYEKVIGFFNTECVNMTSYISSFTTKLLAFA